MKSITKKIIHAMLIWIVILNVVLPCLTTYVFAAEDEEIAEIIKNAMRNSIENDPNSFPTDINVTISASDVSKYGLTRDVSGFSSNKTFLSKNGECYSLKSVKIDLGNNMYFDLPVSQIYDGKGDGTDTGTITIHYAPTGTVKEITDTGEEKVLYEGCTINWCHEGAGGTIVDAFIIADSENNVYEWGIIGLNDLSISTDSEYLGNYANDIIEYEQPLSLENYIAMAINAIANGLNSVVSSVFSEPVTMDKLIFNHYNETQISFFEGEGSGSSIIWGQNGQGGLSGTVNTWYSIFRKIALVVYMILLVYMGVRIMLSSAGKNMAMYKTLFMYWCIGVAILLLYPYAMKYTIRLNNAFVQMVESSKSAILGSNDSSLTTAEGEKVDDLLTIDFDKNPFGTPATNSTDYMAVIADRANSSLRFALALTYLILTWQLITLIIYYYKRVFTIALLIIIFPLVAASFAIDRIADGKSQAFDKWVKEFMLNVLIQSFHAIVYVFVCGTVAVTIGSGSDATMDYVLILTGITFMFTGEEIIKRIFTQGESSTTKSLAKTTTEAVGVIGATTLAGNMVAKVAKPIIGKDSIFAKVGNLRAEARAGELALNNFDRNASQQENPHSGSNLSGLRDELDKIGKDQSLTPSEKIDRRAEARRMAQAVDTLNNPNDVSVNELAEAYQTVMNTMNANPSNAILNNLQLSRPQLNAMSALAVSAATMAVAGNSSKVIEQDITVKLSMILDGMDENTIGSYKNAFMQNLAVNGSTLGYTKERTQEEASQMYSDVEMMFNSFNFRYTDIDSLSDEQLEKARKDRDEYVDSTLEDIQKVFEQHRKEYFAVKKEYDRLNSEADVSEDEKQKREKLLEGFKKELDEFKDNSDVLAESMAVFLARKDGVYSAKEQFEAINNLNTLIDNNTFSSEVIKDLGLTKEDIDLYLHTLASKMSNDSSLSDDTKDMAKKSLENYEGENADLREGLTDTEFSYHEAIKYFGNDDDYQQMTRRVDYERRMANQKAWEATMKIGEEYISANGIDVDKGKFDDTTMYVDGKTKDEMYKEYDDAQRRAKHPFGTLTKDEIKKRYDKYIRDYDK